LPSLRAVWHAFACRVRLLRRRASDEVPPLIELHLCFAKRGNKPRTSALNAALDKARRNYESDFGYTPKARIEITPSTPKEIVCLQVVDYFLWALQRFYESSEDQYLGVIWPKTALVYDMDDRKASGYGVYYNQNYPLTLGVRAKKSQRI